MNKIIITIYKLLYFLNSICIPVILQFINKVFVRLFGRSLQLFGVNAVVLKNITDNFLVLGIPEKIVKTNINIKDYA